ncbi:MAG TPA: ABATE domain-containing protein [Streptosporangiaceae bacterium]|jgi:predicted RNA-binding Zn ribbon-like protein
MPALVPRTADGEKFRFRAGRPSLDLCSTLLWRYVTPAEQLRSPGDLARWAAAAGLQPVPRRASEDDLRVARSLREALYRLFHAHLDGRDLPPADVRCVNAAAAPAGAVPQLIVGGQLRWRASRPAQAALSAVARDGIDLLTGPLAGRIRECAEPDCAFLFADTSRPGQRRWCAMNRCGNRHHVRAHRARRPDGRQAGP